jgi:hypothetical protein
MSHCFGKIIPKLNRGAEVAEFAAVSCGAEAISLTMNRADFECAIEKRFDPAQSSRPCLFFVALRWQMDEVDSMD